MALLKSLSLNNGMNVEDAYIRIDGITGSKENLQIGVNSYVSQEGFNKGYDYLEQRYYTFTPSVEDDAPNFIKQGYEHLKTLLAYESAVDV